MIATTDAASLGQFTYALVGIISHIGRNNAPVSCMCKTGVRKSLLGNVNSRNLQNTLMGLQAMYRTLTVMGQIVFMPIFWCIFNEKYNVWIKCCINGALATLFGQGIRFAPSVTHF